MRRRYSVGAGKVGDSPCDAQNAVIGYQIIRKKVNNDFELLGESQSQFDPFLRGALLCALVETGLYGVEEINEIIKECGFIELLPLQNPFDWYIRKVLQKLGR